MSPPPPPNPQSLEEEPDYIKDLIWQADQVCIRKQFLSYTKPHDDLQPGDKVYAAILLPTVNTKKLQSQWSGPLVITQIINSTMIKIWEIDVPNLASSA